MRHAILLGIITSALVGGCITKAAHEETLRDLALARTSVRREQLTNADLRKAIHADEGKMSDLQTALSEQEELVAQLTVDRAKVQQELAKAKTELAQLQARAETSERDLAESLKTRARLKESVARMSEALGVLSARHLAAQARVAEYRDLLARFEKMIDAGTLSVRVAEGRMVLTMPMDVLFPTGSARLSVAGQDTIAEVGNTLAQIRDRKFQVEGHTDNVPIHNEHFASNWELAAGRALVVVHALLDTGVAPTQVSAASFAEFQPRADNADESGRANNRRIEIVVVPDLTDLPGTEELERISGAS